jgi:hypothetical protein
MTVNHQNLAAEPFFGLAAVLQPVKPEVLKSQGIQNLLTGNSSRPVPAHAVGHGTEQAETREKESFFVKLKFQELFFHHSAHKKSVFIFLSYPTGMGQAADV